MRTIEQRLRRLERNVIGQIVLVTLAIILWLAYSLLMPTLALRDQVRVVASQQGELHFQPGSDGPFVITHLCWKGGQAVAALTQPIAIIDSEGANLGRKELVNLIWVDHDGATVKPPPADEIVAIYYRAERSKPPLAR